MGKKTVRGINCDQWRTCLTWAPLQSTFTLDYYFTGIKYKLLKGTKTLDDEKRGLVTQENKKAPNCSKQ